MKYTKPLLCTAVLSAASAAQAGTLEFRDIYGQMDGMNVVGATADPTLTVMPSNPTFVIRNLSLTYTGSNIGDADFAFTGLSGVMDFNSYSTAIDAGIGGKATVTQSRAVYEIGATGTVSWDRVTKTLTLGQMLKYTDAKDSQMGGRTGTLTQSFVNQNSDAVAKWSSEGVAGSCAPVDSTVCKGQSQFFVGKPDMEKFYLTLTFLAPGKVMGSAIGIDVGGKLPLGETGVQLSKYSFNATADAPAYIPIPAAAWLFGSALVGLGAARRRV